MIKWGVFIFMAWAWVQVTYAETQQSATQRLFKPIIVLKCEQELVGSTLWKGATWLMSEQQKTASKKTICTCVSEHAMDHMTAHDLFKAAMNEEQKNKIIHQGIKNSIRGCVKQTFNR